MTWNIEIYLQRKLHHLPSGLINHHKDAHAESGKIEFDSQHNRKSSSHKSQMSLFPSPSINLVWINCYTKHGQVVAVSKCKYQRIQIKCPNHARPY